MHERPVSNLIRRDQMAFARKATSDTGYNTIVIQPDLVEDTRSAASAQAIR